MARFGLTGLPRHGWTIATVAALAACAALVHPRLGDADPICPAPSGNTTFTMSTTTSSETITTEETVRVDTFATRIVGRDPDGAVVYDQTLADPFGAPAVTAAVGAAVAAVQAGPFATTPVVKGPTLLATDETLVDTDVTTVETGRMDDPPVFDTVSTIGPACIGVNDRDVANTEACTCMLAPEQSCSSGVPGFGTPYCVLNGTINFNTNEHTHTTIEETATTTETYLTSTAYTVTASLLDHYVLYGAKPTKGTPKLAAFGPVTLADALGTADYDVQKLPALALPADKNAEGRADPDTHLARYALKRRKAAGKFAKVADVAVQNQCGGLTLTLAKPESLLVPVAKALVPPPPGALDPLTHEVDHFLCYKAKAQKKRSDGTPVATVPKGTQVDAVDQFQTRRYDVKKPTRLCVPVATSGAPALLKGGGPVSFVPAAVRHPSAHLVCYQAKLASKLIAQNGCGPADPAAKGTKLVPKQPKHVKRTGVQVNGPLGAAVLSTTKELEICVPSTATLP